MATNKELQELDKTILAVNRVGHRLPDQLGTVAVNFFKQRFRDQNWIDNYTEPWKPRKEDKNRRRRNRKRRGILTLTGRLRRSIRKIRVTSDSVLVGTDVPYAEAHNEGVRKNVTVKEHERTKHKKEKERYTDRRGRNRTRTKKVDDGKITVKRHTRKMNLQRRRFAGRSAALDRLMQRYATAQYMKSLK